MENYEGPRVKLKTVQLKKLKPLAKNKTKTTTKNNNSHELFLTKWQKTKTRNVFGNNMYTDIKFSKG